MAAAERRLADTSSMRYDRILAHCLAGGKNAAYDWVTEGVCCRDDTSWRVLRCVYAEVTDATNSDQKPREA